MAWLLGGIQLRAADENGPPRLVLYSDGPLAPVRVLAFAPDNESFFSAGDDKLACRWTLQRAGAQGVRPVLTQRLRWEIARGYRGVVYTLAIDRGGKQIAFAGYSARRIDGDIAVYDVASGELDEVLRGHTARVVSLSFSPSGRRLVSQSMEGEIRVWEAPRWTSRVLRKADVGPGALVEPRPAVFISEDSIAAAEPGKRGAWKIKLYRLSLLGESLLSQAHERLVTALCADTDTGRWATADASGRIYLWEGTRSPVARVLTRRAGRIPYGLAFGIGGELFIATQAELGGDSALEMWDVAKRTLVDQVSTGRSDNNTAFALSGDGKWVVTYGGEHGELMLFALRDETGMPLVKPLSEHPPARVRGSAESIGTVAFESGEGYRLGLGGRSPEGGFGGLGLIDRVFDLANNRIAPIPQNEGAPWRRPTDGAGEWSVVPDDHNQLLKLVREGVERGRIRLDKTFQGPARCYCWLSLPNGAPYGLAVGTEHEHGIYVYALPDQRGSCRLLRYFRDHQGMVTSLSVSSDGKYLASASADRTVKIWSLDDVLALEGAFAREHAWGAVFQVRGDEVLVSSVHAAGIAARREINEGDTITLLQYYRQGEVVETDRPAEIVKALETTNLWDGHRLIVRTPGERRVHEAYLVPGWEPLATLFVDRRGEWAFWTPQGYYNASVHGDELFGWQLNQEWDRKPRFLRADQMREDLERPEAMRRLLEAGNLPDALKTAGIDIPAELQDRISLWASAIPQVRIQSPVQEQRFAKGQKIRVEALVDFPESRKAEDYRVTCYVNGVPAEALEREPRKDQVAYRWETAAVNRHNCVRVVAEDARRRQDSKFAFADVFVRGEPELRQHRLHIFALATGDYAGSHRLEFPVDDAYSVIEAIQSQTSQLYDVGHVQLLLDRQITPNNVRRAIAETQGALRDAAPEDLLVVFVAGHGTVANKEYYFIPPFRDYADFSQGRIEDTCVPWVELRTIADVPCRKVLLFDTCRSGDVFELEDDPAYLWKAAIRPLSRTETLVLTATSPGENSYEDASLKHGCFTFSLLEAMKGQADGLNDQGSLTSAQDRLIDLSELSFYSVLRVPSLSRGLHTPRFSPSTLGFVPLVAY